MEARFGQKYYGRHNTFHYRCHFNLKLHVIKKLSFCTGLMFILVTD